MKTELTCCLGFPRWTAAYGRLTGASSSFREGQQVRSHMILATGFLFLTGCVPSLHPLFTEHDLVFDHRLVGAWSQGDSKDTWTFQKSGPTEYRLVTTDRPFAMDAKTGGKRSDRFGAHLCRLGTYLFLDLYPQEPQITTTDFYKAHLVAAHSFVKVSIDEDSLHLAPLSHDWVENMIARNQ